LVGREKKFFSWLREKPPVKSTMPEPGEEIYKNTNKRSRGERDEICMEKDYLRPSLERG